MKKVLFLIDTIQTGGAEKSLSLIAANFSEYKPVFVQIYVGSKIRPSAISDASIEVKYLNIKGKFSFGKAAQALVPVIEKERPTIIHSTLFRADMVSRRLKKKFPDIPLINSFVNNSYSNVRYNSLKLKQKFTLKFWELYDRFTAGRVDVFISNSEAIKSTNAKALHIDPEKVKVIFRGREIPEKDFPVEELEVLKKELGIEDKKVLINVSRQLERKGQMDLIEALPDVFQQHEDVVLIMAGEGPIRPALEKRSRELGLGDRVLFLGHRNDVLKLLAVSDIFVFPSYYEGLPGALLEAMIAQNIIICSEIPENRECVNEEAALFFEVGNVKDLSDKLNHTLHNEQELKSLGLKAKKQAIENFDVKKIARDYEMLYDMFNNSQ